MTAGRARLHNRKKGGQLAAFSFPPLAEPRPCLVVPQYLPGRLIGQDILLADVDGRADRAERRGQDYRITCATT